MEADELFTTGTAVVVCAVGSLTYKGERKQFGTPGQPGVRVPPPSPGESQPLLRAHPRSAMRALCLQVTAGGSPASQG